MDGRDIRQAVQKQYGAIAAAVTSRTGASCCKSSCCSTEDPTQSFGVGSHSGSQTGRWCGLDQVL